jgi:addiction module HigA family antidote
MNNNMRPIHPGEVLREEFVKPLQLSATALSIALGVPATRIWEILKERRAISPDTALRLAVYFGTTAEFWINLQSQYDLKIQRKKHRRALQKIAPFRQAG